MKQWYALYVFLYSSGTKQWPFDDQVFFSIKNIKATYI